MPTFILHTNLSDSDLVPQEDLHQEIRKIISKSIGKSEDFVLTLLQSNVKMQFGKKDGASAYCEVKNVGTLSPDITNQITNSLTETLSLNLKISPDRIYIEFQESARHLWGWNGKTFA